MRSPPSTPFLIAAVRHKRVLNVLSAGQVSSAAAAMVSLVSEAGVRRLSAFREADDGDSPGSTTAALTRAPTFSRASNCSQAASARPDAKRPRQGNETWRNAATGRPVRNGAELTCVVGTRPTPPDVRSRCCNTRPVRCVRHANGAQRGRTRPYKPVRADTVKARGSGIVSATRDLAPHRWCTDLATRSGNRPTCPYTTSISNPCGRRARGNLGAACRQRRRPCLHGKRRQHSAEETSAA